MIEDRVEQEMENRKDRQSDIATLARFSCIDKGPGGEGPQK
jgi:hypothetical protein